MTDTFWPFLRPLSQARNIRYIFHMIMAGSDHDGIKSLEVLAQTESIAKDYLQGTYLFGPSANGSPEVISGKMPRQQLPHTLASFPDLPQVLDASIIPCDAVELKIFGKSLKIF